MSRATSDRNVLIPGKRIYGATIGIAMMDRTFPRPLGDMGNALSYDFPVIYDIVHGVAGMPALSVEKTQDLFEPLLASCRRLVDMGATAVTTTCGYAALLQKQISAELPVTFAASSLVQIPMILSVLSENQKIGVLAARGPGLRKEHFLGTGVFEGDLGRLHVVDLQKTTALRAAILDEPGVATLDVEFAEEEIVKICQDVLAEDPNIGAFVAECANVGPYSAAIQQATNKPVWDSISLVNWLFAGRSCTF